MRATAASGASRTWVFVIGTGRSGSTLVQEVLARHPKVGFVSNVEDRFGHAPVPSRANGPLYRHMPQSWTRKGRLRFAPSEGYRALAREVSPILSDPSRDLVADDVTPWLAGRFLRFFEGRAERQGAPVFLHKFTGWPRARFVQAVLPTARFVHVVRDGRAVASSLLQMPWWTGHLGPSGWPWGPLPEEYSSEWEASGRSFVVLAGLAWKILMDAFEDARDAVPPPQWIDVRYEDILSDPGSTFDELLAFAGLEGDGQFAAGLRRSRLDRSRAAAFRKDLTPAQVEALEACLGPRLEKYGYS